jgi:hypothetical protein
MTSWETERRSQFPNRRIRILRVKTWETGNAASVSQKAQKAFWPFLEWAYLMKMISASGGTRTPTRLSTGT